MSNANITYNPLPGKSGITFLVSGRFYTIQAGANSFDSTVVAAIGAAALKDKTLLSYVNTNVLIIDNVTAPNPGSNSSGSNSGSSSGSSNSGSSSGSSTSSGGSVTNTGGGRKIILLVGQSNCEGSGAGIDLNFDYSDPRISQYPPVATYANQIIEASEPLIHNGYGVAGKIGFGLSFAKRYLLENPTSPILLLPCALGGTGFQDNHWNPGNSLFTAAVTQANNVLAANNNNQLVAILWHQGENDIGMGRTAYQTALITMINAFRSQINGATNVPFILGELAPAFIAGDSVRTSINESIKEIPALLTHTYVTSGAGLNTESDNIHYNAASQRIFGQRYFTSFQLAANNTLQTPVTPTSLSTSAISNSTATIIWNSDPYSFKWEYQYKKTSDSAWSSSIFTNSVSNVLSSLTPGTSYQFKVRAVNANNTSTTFTTPVSFTTSSAPAGSTGVTTSGVVPKVFLPMRGGDVSDHSGNGKNGILHGGASVIADPTFSSNAINHVLSLIGNQWLEIPVGCNTSYTKTLRVCEQTPSSGTNPTQHLLGDPANPTTAAQNDLFILHGLGNDNHEQFAMGHGGVEVFRDYQYFIPTIWQHIAITYDNTTKIYTAYFDGQSHGSNSTPAANFAGGGSSMFIGHPTTASNMYVCDVKYFDSVLSASDIADEATKSDGAG